ncbi:hormogonium polysaccharide secretion pseudopilin HpsC [Dolichospermum circinale]|uniref:hormogonium polysaccharide secretion pseudopilin HpsC n=1 Tax=Dolichospermum circinale TaxID=109265 RepID=UPI00232D4CC3|nr:hormogonium polysaccharide secretion pseudopilin HpsC [Dolichospermum circinale]MDB9453549.1 hormogonium polysaccharide secretion pseudopilin HpsC [Dolichospermum circinale CS-541/06]MDB9462939.1 hormogonium polysaccharide secretion pseudopilin HpsC [Dolichospermum circinale CS-541/04]MDB9546601.1 hormogonium polysaccharide secretion pseudopilin HpsC [Dolichospermum circinale CS-1031]
MMIKILKFIFKNQFKASKSLDKSAGFTLVELLIALAMSSVMITLLLQFMITMINTDSDEEIKINSEQEIQIALDYISRDLQQAIYIYDAAGINAIKDQLRYPNDDTKTPILVFWKREIPDNNSAGEDNSSLVVYYLDNSSSTIWSKAARISKWQIKKNDPGFNPFNIAQYNTVEDAMNKWQKSGTAYTTDANVLIDYVDQTTPPLVPTIPPTPPAATCPDNTITPPITWSKITPSNDMTGFYACVDKANTTAKVFIRGNALARRESDPNLIKYENDKKRKSYFPTASAIVQGAKSGY